MSEIKKVKRSEFASFLNVGTKSNPEWKRMGKGITEQNVSYNPTTTTETYIDEDNATTNVESYAISVSTPQTAYAGEPVFDYVDGLRKKHAVGSECETQIMFVYIYDEISSGKYSAELNDAVIAVGEFGGQGGQSVVINYTVNINGNATQGDCTISGGVPTFTPAE